MLHYIYNEDAYAYGQDGDPGVTLIVDLPRTDQLASIAVSAMAIAKVFKVPPQGISHTVDATALPSGLNFQWYDSMAFAGDLGDSETFAQAESLHCATLPEIERLIESEFGNEWGECDMLYEAKPESARISSVDIHNVGCNFNLWHSRTAEIFQLCIAWEELGFIVEDGQQ